MDIGQLKKRVFEKEFYFSTSRSTGPGGQNVNKVNSKVELRFDIYNSIILTQEEKQILLSKTSQHLTNIGELLFISQTSRSQFTNKETTIEKFYSYLVQALTPQKKRKPTRPSKNSIEKRLTKKRILSEIKHRRKKPDL